MGERFEIREELGRDYTAALYRAFDCQMQRDVILKRLMPGTEAELGAHILREARALAQLSSPRVLGVYEVGEDEHGPFLSLEPPRGESLRARLEQFGPLEILQVIRHGLQLCEALSAVHRASLVHGDLRLDHVYLDEGGDVHLGGFALARRAPTAPTSSATIGQTTSMCSSAREGPYAPEEGHGDPIDGRSDVFALGVLMVEALTGQLPFAPDGSIDADLVRRARPDVPEALDGAVRKALSAFPEERWSSAADFASALRAATVGAALPAMARPRASAKVPSGGSRRWPMVAVAAGILLLGGGWFFFGPSTDLGAKERERGVVLDPPDRSGTYQHGYRESHALVVGIDNYSHSAWPSLERAEDDARALRDFLVEEETFEPDNVTLLLGKEATLQAILDTLLSKFADPERVASDDRVLFFFAGHGQQQQARGLGGKGQVGFLVPQDATSSPASYVMHDVILRAGDLIPAKHFLLLLDCCYSGWALQRSGLSDVRRDAAMREPARQVLTAGRPGEPVSDFLAGSMGHSPFTHYLLEGLRQGTSSGERDFVTASELGRYVKDQVQLATSARQSPAWGTLSGMGDFVFQLRKP